MVSGPHPPPNVQADSQDLFMQAHPITLTACVRGIYMVIRIRLVQLPTVTALFLQTCTHTKVRLLSMIEWQHVRRAELVMKWFELMLWQHRHCTLSYRWPTLKAHIDAHTVFCNFVLISITLNGKFWFHSMLMLFCFLLNLFLLQQHRTHQVKRKLWFRFYFCCYAHCLYWK